MEDFSGFQKEKARVAIVVVGGWEQRKHERLISLCNISLFLITEKDSAGECGHVV
jgi:hypothetical protein